MKKENIFSKDNNIDPMVYQILNEAYNEFRDSYGDKHSSHVKELIENLTDKVEKIGCYYFGSPAMANPQMGVRYAKSDKLSAILKHELWHVYNNVATDRNISLQYIPERYMEKLEQMGYLREFYNATMDMYKEKWKDEPERLKNLLVDYEEFKNNRFDFGASTVEIWTEWFSSKTHLKDMKDNFFDWGNGYFTKSHSSGSFYDIYINIADMISCIIPKEKLLEMYLQTKDYKTDYSYPEMLEELDTTYANSLSEEEQEKYGYTYLKIIMDIITVYENARKNPNIAREALQSCMKTCFNAYFIKLDNIQDMDISKAKQIYSEIKYMQESMVWNIDISNIEGLDYTQAMNRIQDKFKMMLQGLNLETSEIQRMSETIDYKVDNPYKVIEDGEEISKRINDTQNDQKGQLISLGEFKANIGENGIKNNLYATLFALVGKERYNLLYENFNNGNADNVLLKFHRLIKSATNENDIISIYNEIYELYAQKLENNLKTDENIDYLLNRYSKEIVELQRNGLFNEKEQKYLPQLERIIDIYNERIKAYVQAIDRNTEEQKKTFINMGNSVEDATRFAERVPNMYKKNLVEYQSRIVNERTKQSLEYTEILENAETKSTQELGKETLEEQKDTAELDRIEATLETQERAIANQKVEQENPQSL